MNRIVFSILLLLGWQGVSAQTEALPKFPPGATQPGFPGGDEKLAEFLRDSVVYPAEAKAKNIEGRVLVSFVVNKDGSLSEFHVCNELGGGTSEEVLRVLRAMPKWIPAKLNGKRVRVKYTLPVTFKLE